MASVAELCKDLSSDDQIKAYQARTALAEMTAKLGASGKEADRATTAKELAEALAALKPAKDNRGEPTIDSMRAVQGATDICRALASIGGDPEAVVLKELLKNIDLREPARWALVRLSCQAATDALVDSLKTATGTEFRVGVVNGLAKKSGSAVVDALKAALADQEPEVRLAAAEALAETPMGALDTVIAGADAGTTSRGKARVARARIRLGNTLDRGGDKDGAKTVFTAVAGSEVDEAQKKAAAAALATLG
jgi:hypothetical protein